MHILKRMGLCTGVNPRMPCWFALTPNTLTTPAHILYKPVGGAYPAGDILPWKKQNRPKKTGEYVPIELEVRIHSAKPSRPASNPGVFFSFQYNQIFLLRRRMGVPQRDDSP